jgi:hypothetical protein
MPIKNAIMKEKIELQRYPITKQLVNGFANMKTNEYYTNEEGSLQNKKLNGTTSKVTIYPS